MRVRSGLGVTLALLFGASPAFAVKEWYDHYLLARDRLIPARPLQRGHRQPAGGGAAQAQLRRERADLRAPVRRLSALLPARHLLPAHGATSTARCGCSTSRRTRARSSAAPPTASCCGCGPRPRAARASASRGWRAKTVERLLEGGHRSHQGPRSTTTPWRASPRPRPGPRASTPRRSNACSRCATESAPSSASWPSPRAADSASNRRWPKARRLLDEGRPTEAIVRFDEVLTLDPRNARAEAARKEAQERILASHTRQKLQQRFAEGRRLFEAGRYEEAIEPLTEAAADPADAEAQGLLAQARKLVEGMRSQKELKVRIDALLAEADRLAAERKFAEAWVKLDRILQLDPENVKAQGAPRLRGAHDRRGSCSRFWMPNLPPLLTFFEPKALEVEGRSVGVVGVATDDRGVVKIEFLQAGKVVGQQVPPPRAELGEAQRSLRFDREFPLEPGANEITVVSYDTQGETRSETFRIERRLRFWERKAFFPSAAGVRLRPGRHGLRLPARPAAARRAEALQPLHRRRARARRRDVLRAREADGAHPERAPPQQPDDHGRAPHREDDVPVPPEEGARDRRGHRLPLLPGVHRPPGRPRGRLLPRRDGRRRGRSGALPRNTRDAALSRRRRLRRPRLQPRPAARGRGAEDAHPERR